jgi:hypothetical protein
MVPGIERAGHRADPAAVRFVDLAGGGREYGAVVGGA